MFLFFCWYGDGMWEEEVTVMCTGNEWDSNRGSSVTTINNNIFHSHKYKRTRKKISNVWKIAETSILIGVTLPPLCIYCHFVLHADNSYFVASVNIPGSTFEASRHGEGLQKVTSRLKSLIFRESARCMTKLRFK